MATINGTNNDDTLTGSAQDDLINGLGGDDLLIGRGGDDVLDGGTDTMNDIASYLSASGSVTVNLATGTATGADGNDTLTNIEFVFGSNFNDTLTGDKEANFLRGNQGNDALDGGGQSIALERGNFAGDFADYQGASGAVTVSLLAGTATGAAGNDTLVNFESIRGSAFGDTLIGHGGNNFLRGGLGNDILQGGGGNRDFADYRNATAGITASLVTHTSSGVDGVDTLSGIEGLSGSDFDDTLDGNGGDNWFRGRQGDDTFNGGAGFDMVTYRPSGGGVVVVLENSSATGAEDTDSLNSIEGVEGSMFNDVLIGKNTAANALFGFGGDDTFGQTLGADTLDGGDGFDQVSFVNTGIGYGGAVGATVNLATGASDADNSAAGAMTTLVSIEQVTGTAGNDRFVGGDLTHAPDVLGSSEVEVFRPLGGDDTITGASGNGFTTRVDYSTNTSAIAVNLGTRTATDGFGGVDTLIRIDQVRAGSGDDVLNGGGQERADSGNFFEQFRGNAGNDTIDGAGTDTVVGAAGTDRVDYANSPGAAIVNLGTTSFVAGSDTVAGGTARDGFGDTDTLINIDQVQGSIFNDTLVGGADNHRLIGRAGNDSLVGSVEGVEASYQSALAGVTVSLASGFATDGEGGVDTLVNISDLRGSAFDDTLTGDSGGNRIHGDPGADTINGRGGIDLASYSTTPLANGGINAFIESGAGMVEDGFGSTDTLTNIEGLIGTHSNDTLGGGLGDQWFAGRGGSDVINGGAGSDWVQYGGSPGRVTVNLGTGSATDGWGGVWRFGGTDTLTSIENVEGSDFNDSLTGKAGANSLRGLGGNDVLRGAAGNDVLTGGMGADKFFFNSALNAATNVDTISDFASGVDRMYLDQTFFTGLATGNLPGGRFYSAPGATGAGDATDRIIYDSTNGDLYFDADGTAGASAAILFANLTGAPVITAGDFFIIA